MLLQCLGQPGIKVDLFASTRPHQIWLPTLQTFSSGQTNEIFRCCYFIFEVFVFRFDMGNRFCRRMGLAVPNKGRVRFSDVIQKIIDALLQRFGRETSIGETKDESEKDRKSREKDHDYYFAAMVCLRCP